MNDVITTREASSNRGCKLIGVFALFVWMHGVFGLWPLPGNSDSLPINLQWSLWVEILLFTFFGMIAGVMAYRSIRLWWLMILVTSGIVVLINVPPLVTNLHDSPSFEHCLKVWFMVFHRLMDEDRGVFAVQTIYGLFVYPLYHLILVISAVFYVILAYRESRNVGTTAA
ncbi:MAG: hypothetical protein ACREUW_13240 [Burkholderiales bacterium]